MPNAATRSVEEKVLASLQAEHGPMDLEQLIERIRSSDVSVRAVEVKIAALGLVSKGSVNLNESWQLLTTS